MKTWENLVKTGAAVNRASARYAAHQIADEANQVGMFASDCLELMISAAQSSAGGETVDEWWEALTRGRFTNQANGINLSWMPDQFTKAELVHFGRRGVRLTGSDPDKWGSVESKEASGIGYVQGSLPSAQSEAIDLVCDELGVMGRSPGGQSINSRWSAFSGYWRGTVRFPDFMPVESGEAIVLFPAESQSPRNRVDLVVYSDEIDEWLAHLESNEIPDQTDGD